MLEARRQAYLDAMGVTCWVTRFTVQSQAALPSQPVPAANEPPESVPPIGVKSAVPARPDGGTADWDGLREQVGACQLCGELVRNRTQTVFGVGNPRADWMVIGEAPGVDEDRQGEPFVGRAGQLLNAMLGALGLAREDVYIANILKCRPPDNRDPRPEEAASCHPHLSRQIELVAPRVILAVGRIAAQNLLGTDAPLGRLRGRIHCVGDGGLPLVVTYHPAYLLRSPEQKAKTWQDLLLAASVVRGSGSPA